MDGEDMQSNALGMVQQMANMQFNSAKVTIKWDMYGHSFEVESMNPASAFDMTRKVKAVAKAEFESKSVKKNGKEVH